MEDIHVGGGKGALVADLLMLDDPDALLTPGGYPYRGQLSKDCGICDEEVH